MIGKVNKVFEKRGYGFIVTEENEEFFFHISSLKNCTWKEVVSLSPPNTAEGPQVYFKEQKHPRGPRAYHVELVT